MCVFGRVALSVVVFRKQAQSQYKACNYTLSCCVQETGSVSV